MQYNKAPSIVNVEPARFKTNVHVAAKVVITFDSDIDKTSIANNVHLYNEAGKPVDIRCSYDNKILTVTPQEKLNSEETYRVTVHGDNNPNGAAPQGIRNVVGLYMLGDYDWVFTTKNALDSLEIITDGTPNEVVINDQPLFKFHIPVNTGALSSIVELQLSKSKLFDSIIWVGTSTPEEGITGIRAGIYLTDGTYYWRARIVRGSDNGVWSDPYQFNLNTIPRTTIFEDDTLPLDPAFPSDWEACAPTITSVTPDNNVAGLSLNTQAIAVTIDGIIPIEEIDADSLYITCEPNNSFTNTSNDNNMLIDHDADIDVIHNLHDNTTTLIQKLKPLSDSLLLDYTFSLPAVYIVTPCTYIKKQVMKFNIKAQVYTSAILAEYNVTL